MAAKRMFEEDGSLIIQSTHDTNAALNFAQQLRDRGENVGESKIIGTAPAWLVSEWLKEAGVAWDDPAADDVIQRKLMSGDVSALRVWEGNV